MFVRVICYLDRKFDLFDQDKSKHYTPRGIYDFFRKTNTQTFKVESRPKSPIYPLPFRNEILWYRTVGRSLYTSFSASRSLYWWFGPVLRSFSKIIKATCRIRFQFFPNFQLWDMDFSLRPGCRVILFASFGLV